MLRYFALIRFPLYRFYLVSCFQAPISYLQHPLLFDMLAVGTPGYTPAEILSNPASATQTVDTYSYGVVLSDVYSGRINEGEMQHFDDLLGDNFIVDSAMLLSAEVMQPLLAVLVEFGEQCSRPPPRMKKDPRRPALADPLFDTLIGSSARGGRGDCIYDSC
jgi:hypothetical protein